MVCTGETNNVSSVKIAHCDQPLSIIAAFTPSTERGNPFIPPICWIMRHRGGQYSRGFNVSKSKHTGVRILWSRCNKTEWKWSCDGNKPEVLKNTRLWWKATCHLLELQPQDSPSFFELVKIISKVRWFVICARCSTHWVNKTNPKCSITWLQRFFHLVTLWVQMTLKFSILFPLDRHERFWPPTEKQAKLCTCGYHYVTYCVKVSPPISVDTEAALMEKLPSVLVPPVEKPPASPWHHRHRDGIKIVHAPPHSRVRNTLLVSIRARTDTHTHTATVSIIQMIYDPSLDLC